MRWMPSGSQSELSKTVFLCHNQSIGPSIGPYQIVSFQTEIQRLWKADFKAFAIRRCIDLNPGRSRLHVDPASVGKFLTFSTSFISWLSDYPGRFSIGINNWSDDFQNCFLLFWNLAISQFAWFFRVRGGRHSGHQALVPSQALEGLHSFSFIPFVPFVHPPFHQVSFPFGWYFRLFAVLATSLCDMGVSSSSICISFILPAYSAQCNAVWDVLGCMRSSNM